MYVSTAHNTKRTTETNYGIVLLNRNKLSVSSFVLHICFAFEAQSSIHTIVSPSYIDEIKFYSSFRTIRIWVVVWCSVEYDG